MGTLYPAPIAYDIIHHSPLHPLPMYSMQEKRGVNDKSTLAPVLYYYFRDMLKLKDQQEFKDRNHTWKIFSCAQCLPSSDCLQLAFFWQALIRLE